MKPVIKSAGLAVLFTTALLSLACGSKVVVTPAPAAPVAAGFVNPTPSQVVVTTVPATPVPPQETVSTVSPGPGYVWVAGSYNWVGDHYVWMPGSWMMPPRASSAWVAGHWESTTGGYTWIQGHWLYQ
jgi:hypothetical protein